MKKRLLFCTCLLLLTPVVAVLADASQPQQPQTLDGQEQLILSHITNGRYQDADAACDELIERFSADKGIVKAIDNITRSLRRIDNYAKARQLYKTAIETWPNAKSTDDRQRGLARVTIQLVKQIGADDVAGTLITDYSDGQQPAEATAYFGQASGQLGDYELARVLYERFVEQYPQDDWAVWAQMGAAASLLGLGDKEGMDQALGKLTTDYANNLHAQKLAGPFAQLCTYLDDLPSKDERAVETMIYKKLLRDLIEPKSEVILDHIGDFYRDRYEYQKAEELFEYVADTWRGELRAIEAQSNIVRMYISKGDEPNSTRTFDILVEKFATDERLAWAVVQVAERYWDFGSMEPACQKYEQALNINPDYERACWVKMRLIMALIKRSELETAEIKLAELLTEFAGSDQLAPSVHEIVEEYRNSGAHEEGRELFAYIIENWSQDDATNLELQVGLALQSIKLKDEAKANAAVERLIADFNDHPNIGKGLFQIAEQHFYASNHLKTIELLKLIQSSYPESGFPAKDEIHMVLATCYKRLHAADEAIEHYKKMLQNHPSNRYASWCPYNLGWLYHQVKEDQEQALYWYNKQRELFPEANYSSWALFDMACIYIYWLEDYQKGADTCKQYVDQYPDGLDIWGILSNLALCHEKLGNNQKAIDVLRQTYTKSKTDGLRKATLERINNLEKGGAK